MTEPAVAAVSSGPRTAGTLLREARQAQGVHVAALAASMKVSQRKLESLEADRLDELPDATFTRALAQTVCRSLKIDPVPVLALLPHHLPGNRLEHVSEGINEPFRDRPGRREPLDMAVLRSPFAWIVYVLLFASAVVYLMPQRWLSQWQIDRGAARAASAPASSGPAAVEGTTSRTTVTEVLPAASEPAASGAQTSAATDGAAPGVAAAVPAAAVPASAVLAGASAFPALLVRARADSWVEVIDSRSRILLGRTVTPGESVPLDGEPPFRIKVGNAAATELVFQGQPIDLARSTVGNIARLELK